MSLTVKRILMNPIYKGTIAFGQFPRGKYYCITDDGEVGEPDGKHGKYGRRPGAVVIDDAHEAIIDKNTWEQVQETLESRAHTTHRVRQTLNVLGGLVRCGHCGSRLASQRVQNNGHKYAYYTCDGASKGICGAYKIRQEVLDGMVLGLVEKRLFAPGVVEAIREAIRKRSKIKKPGRNAAQSIKAQLATVETKIQSGTENLLVAAKADVPGMSEMLAGLREKKQSLEATLTKLVGGTNGQADTATRAIGQLRRLRIAFEAADPQQKRAVACALIAKITLWWERTSPRRIKVQRGMVELVNNGDGIPVVTDGEPVVFSMADLYPYRKKKRFEQAAEWVGKLYDGEPVSAATVAERMKTPHESANSLLARAKNHGLVTSIPGKGWLPANAVTQ